MWKKEKWKKWMERKGWKKLTAVGFFFFFIGLLVLSKGLAISHPLIFLERSEP
jgi:hypothetical protein